MCLGLVLTSEAMRRWGEKPEPCEYGKEQQKEEKRFHMLRVCLGAPRTQPVHK